ncbi:MAG: hypothetical protein Q4C56_02435 [Peptococcaceae bacterium]|nr:hypothetical protein [Peptococcaceae bacterium]
MKTLNYYTVDGALGWSQDWFRDWWMHVGGCAAVTACDLSILLARDHGLRALYPFDAGEISRADYLAFAKIMKPYLKPRFSGIDKLSIYTEGLGRYAADRGVKLPLVALEGDAPWQEAARLLRRQIDTDLVVPFLLLHHQDKALDDWQWHWFNLAGYDTATGRLQVRAITYGAEHWLDFQNLWETGKDRKGGLVIVDL